MSDAAEPASADISPSLWSRWRGSELATVRLVRHGETRSYRTDSGLTERGRRQAVDKGFELAAGLAPGIRVRLPHAPTARAGETALALHDGITHGLREIPATEVHVDKPHTDSWFDNFRLWCDGQALDPTQAFGTYQAIRESTPTGALPGWFAEMDRFSSILAGGGDPITYWLTQPLQHFEPASTAVRRFWHGIRESVRDAPPGLQVFVSTHSGCIRAVAAAAFGYDPGEPHNTEDVAIRVPPAADRALLSYRGRAVELAVPVTDTPPWCPDATTIPITTRQG